MTNEEVSQKVLEFVRNQSGVMLDKQETAANLLITYAIQTVNQNEAAAGAAVNSLLLVLWNGTPSTVQELVSAFDQWCAEQSPPS